MKRRKKSIAVTSAILAALAAVAVAGVGSAVSSESVGIGVSTEYPQVEAESYPVIISGETTSTGAPEWNLSGINIKVTCDSAQYASALAGPSPSLSIVPTYSGCSSVMLGTKFPTNVKANGCNYLVEMSTELEGVEDVVCPTGSKIQLLLYGSQQSKEEGKTLCEVKIGRQTDVNGANFSGGGGGFLPVATSLSGLEYEYVRNSFLCTKGESTLTYSDTALLTGSN